MAVNEITAQDVIKDGVTPTFEVANADGSLFANDGRTFLVVKNTNAATRDVTIDSLVECNQGHDHDIVVTVGATNGEEWMGPFETSRFNNAQGKAKVTFSDVVDLTIAVVRV